MNLSFSCLTCLISSLTSLISASLSFLACSISAFFFALISMIASFRADISLSLSSLDLSTVLPFKNYQIEIIAVLIVFLVGAFLVKRARLLQWLVFFSFFFVRLFTHRVCTTFCEMFTFAKSTQYLILNASKGLYLEMQNPEGSPFQFFGAMRLSPPLFRLCETFFEIF